MKKTVFFTSLFMGFSCFAQIDDEPFQSYLCKNGGAGSWVNACSCDQGYSGAYCDEPGVPCENKTVNMYVNKGLCYKAITYAPIEYQDKIFYISRSLMNFEDAQDFCKVIGARGVTRKDLNCFGKGIGCVDAQPLVLFQQKTYNRGFVWLEKHPDLKEAYYMDINDGAVYHSDYTSSAVTQAFCIKNK